MDKLQPKKIDTSDLPQSKEDSSINIWKFLSSKSEVNSNCPVQGILVNPKALFSLLILILVYFLISF